jgi:L-2,4-diaminobutyric acid acetyltransferase
MSGPTFRQASPDDGKHLWRLVENIGTLEQNTAYCYLLLTHMFFETCAVVEHGGERVGFLAGFRPPTRPESAFVWQIGVSSEMRGAGLATGLLLQLLAQTDVTHIEATVGVSNAPSRALFASFARHLGASCSVEPYFSAPDFPERHEDEQLFRIGPLSCRTPAYASLAARYRPGLSEPVSLKGATVS